MYRGYITELARDLVQDPCPRGLQGWKSLFGCVGWDFLQMFPHVFSIGMKYLHCGLMPQLASFCESEKMPLVAKGRISICVIS